MIGIEVSPIVNSKIIKEALSRIGIANKKKHILFPSCYLTKHNDIWIIAHFKELFPILTNGLDASSEDDIQRRNTIIGMLEAWKLITIINSSFQREDKFVFVLKKQNKLDWQIKHKINLKTLNRVELS